MENPFVMRILSRYGGRGQKALTKNIEKCNFGA